MVWERKPTCGGNFNNPKRGDTMINMYAWFGDNKFRLLGKSHPNSEILTTGKGVYPVSDYNAE